MGNKDRYRSCWFYDNQLLDRMTSVSLHANTYQDNNNKWRRYESGIDAGGYCLAPLCTSILSEDFQVNIGNTWNEVGGDPVSQGYERYIKPTAPYVNYMKDAIAEIGKKASDWGKTKEGEISGVAKHLTAWAGRIGEVAERRGDDLVDYLNSALISQGTRFTYYSGSGVSFGNLQMRFTMFPIWAADGTFMSVPQQLELLFPYVMGTYENIVVGQDKKGKDVTSALIGWQKPPGGYQAVYKDIDVIGIKGTLKLRLGSFYVLESLVCESMNFSLSRQMVKRPQSVDTRSPAWAGTTKLTKDTGDISLKVEDQMAFSPLFADVILSFRGATKYSDQTMRRFIYGLNIGGKENEGGQDASDVMKKNLESEIMQIENKYEKYGITLDKAVGGISSQIIPSTAKPTTAEVIKGRK